MTMITILMIIILIMIMIMMIIIRITIASPQGSAAARFRSLRRLGLRSGSAKLHRLASCCVSVWVLLLRVTKRTLGASRCFVLRWGRSQSERGARHRTGSVLSFRSRVERRRRPVEGGGTRRRKEEGGRSRRRKEEGRKKGGGGRKKDRTWVVGLPARKYCCFQ